MQVAAAGRVADQVPLDHDDRRCADGESLADERLVGAGLGRAAAALVRGLVRDDARGGRDSDDVEVAPLWATTPRVGVRACQIGAVHSCAHTTDPEHGGVLPLPVPRVCQGAVLESAIDVQEEISTAGRVAD